jgi:guanylate kinase
VRGTLFIISAPSGTGKTTILKEIIATVPRVSFSVSYTTRPARDGEKNEIDYYFVSKEVFSEIRERNDFLEWAEVHGNFYGTRRQTVLEQLEQGNDIILDIDVQGAGQLRNAGLEAVFIFVVPPSRQELEKRLRERGTDNKATIDLRLKNARMEMEAAALYDYLIINDEVPKAVEILKAIIIEKRAMNRRAADGSPLVLPDMQ